MREHIIIELRELIDQKSNYQERFGFNDIRTGFINGYFQILRTYFCAYYHTISDDIIEKYREIYQIDNFDTNQLSWHLQSHRNLLNSFLIINTWSNFELFLTLFSNAVLPRHKIEELLEIDYRRLKKILKDYPLTDNTDEKLKKYIKNHIAHTPIVNKYGKLFKLITNYPTERDKNRDREFLEFFGRLRNCIHSNYIYYGSVAKDFTFNEITFRFRPGELLQHDQTHDDTILIQLTQNLKHIFKVFVENITHNNEIYDPSVGLTE